MQHCRPIAALLHLQISLRAWPGEPSFFLRLHASSPAPLRRGCKYRLLARASWLTPLLASQVWRVATCFMYWGQLSLDFFFHIFFLSVHHSSSPPTEAARADRATGPLLRSMRYSKMLEESAFHGRRADYVWLLIVSCTILLVSYTPSFSFGPREEADFLVALAAQILSPLSPSPFLSSPLSFTVSPPPSRALNAHN